MANFTLPYFGQLDTENLSEYNDATIQLPSGSVDVDLNFDNKRIDKNRLEIAKRFLEQVADFDLRNKIHIEADFNDEEADTVRTYIEHHLEDMDPEELNELINPADKKNSKEKQLLKKLHLVRVGLYPDSEDSFAVFDYSINPELTQYLVVLVIDETGNLNYLTMES